MTEDDLPGSTEAEAFDTDTTYEIELTLQDGTDVVLMARYTPQNQISEGFVIPSLLVYHN